MKTYEQESRSARLQRLVEQLGPGEDPAELISLVDDLIGELEPAGYVEQAMVERMALLSLRIRTCVYLQSDVMRRGMQAAAVPGDTHEMAEGRAFLFDLQGARELEKLSRYQSRLERERSQGFKRLRQLQEIRKRRRPKSAAEAHLELLEPCTSVVQ